MTAGRRQTSARWPKRAAIATLTHLGMDPAAWEVSVLGCDDARIAALNGDFRDKPQPTNVLSWPSEDRAPDTPGAPPVTCPNRGPIRSWATSPLPMTPARARPRMAGKPLSDHITHLIIHAVLHLLGYDHIRDEDATVMQAIEVGVLGKLGISDPY